MKRLIYLFVLAAALCGCICDEEPECGPSTKVTVEMEVRPDPMTVITRTTDDTAIRDVNLYLCDATGWLVVHAYATAPTLRFTCVPGTYRMYVAANLGRDAGEDMLPINLRIEHADEYDVLPMTYEGEVTIAASAKGPVTLPSVVVRRAVAKVSCNISVQPEDMELLSVQLVSVTRSVRLFEAEATPSNNTDDYVDTEILQLGGRAASVEYYLLPNPQGENSSITDQRQKSAENAPLHASRLIIRAVRGDKVLAYRVYLGENNINDFNVCRNTLHTYDITIYGDNEVDTRISGYTVNVHDNLEANGYGGYCVSDARNRLFIDIENNNGIPLYGEIMVIDGESKALFLDGRPVGATGLRFDIEKSNGTNTYKLNYVPSRIFHSGNSSLSCAVIIYDEYGFSRTFSFTRRFANRLHLITRESGNDNGLGTIAVTGALHAEPLSGTAEGLAILCDGGGCTISATPAAGFYFDGWYTDAAMTARRSEYASYAYHAATTECNLYPGFRLLSHSALDGNDTANCYIAPKTVTRYSFNARTMGNGNTTTGISRTLAGTTAKVLWETGTGCGSVVRYATYYNGRIYFSTGAARGNALIGLFDKKGACIWSWHIWAVDCDPAATAVAYSSGAVFMDRNLGAETVTTTLSAAKGLFYQWGRKDPFIFPTTQKATYNLDGYEFRAAGLLAGDVLPASSHTIQWATEHPTVFLTAAPNPRSSAPEAFCSWLSAPSTTLWGKSKTIYDPCPPGWKVPARSAWDTATFKAGNLTSEYGWSMFCADKTITTFYPFNGFLSATSSGLQHYLTTSCAYIWTCEPYDNTTHDYGHAIYISDQGTVNLSTHQFQYNGYGIRCVRE